MKDENKFKYVFLIRIKVTQRDICNIYTMWYKQMSSITYFDALVKISMPFNLADNRCGENEDFWFFKTNKFQFSEHFFDIHKWQFFWPLFFL